MCFIHGNLVNLYISYELDAYSRDLMHQDLITDFVLVNCLPGAVKWAKGDPPNKYGYSVMILDLMHVHNFFEQTVAGVKMTWYELIFGVDNSSSVHVDNKKGCLSSRWRSDTKIRWVGTPQKLTCWQIFETQKIKVLRMSR